MSFRDDPDRERERREVAQEEAMLRRERQDRIEDYTPAPSLPPRVLLHQRHNRERLEMLRRHEAEDKELHEPDCPRTAHGGPCHGPLRFEIAETSLELYERRIEAIETVLARADVHGRTGLGTEGVEYRPLTGERLRELAVACYSAGQLGF